MFFFMETFTYQIIIIIIPKHENDLYPLFVGQRSCIWFGNKRVSCDKMLLVLILKLSADIPPLTVFPS